MSSSWRLIESGPGRAAWNMAVDEALLEQATAREAARPVLRLYRWRPAAISLGRFQPAADVTVPPGADLVRRLSGGGAIHHQEDEVTYAVVAPYARFGGRSPRLAYEAIHGAIRAALERLGVRLGERTAPALPAGAAGMCFARATDYDIVAGERKLVGSAQRRKGRWFLQHGSLPLSPDPLAPEATSLAELLEDPPLPHQVETALLDAFTAHISELDHDALHKSENDLAQMVMRARYQSESWTRER